MFHNQIMYTRITEVKCRYVNVNIKASISHDNPYQIFLRNEFMLIL